MTVEQLIPQPRGRGRGASRSPSPLPHPGATFFPASTTQPSEEEEAFTDADETINMEPIPADASPDEIRRIAEAARQESQAMRSNQDRMTAALEAATQAAAAATAALQALSLNRGTQAAPANLKRK